MGRDFDQQERSGISATGDKQQGPYDVQSKQKPDSKRVLTRLPKWQATETQAGGLDHFLNQNGYGLRNMLDLKMGEC